MPQLQVWEQLFELFEHIEEVVVDQDVLDIKVVDLLDYIDD